MLDQPLVDSHTGAATTLLEANISITEQLDRKGRNVERAVIWTIVLIAFSAAAFLSSMIRSVLV